MRRILVLVLALALVAPAAADIGVLSVSRTSARPGDVVVVRFGGYTREWPRMPAYLVPSGRAPRLRPCGTNAFCAPVFRRPPATRPYVFIGRIHYAPPARGRLRFRVPRVAAGTYRFVVFCAPCHKGPGGSLVVSTRALIVR